MMRIAFLAALLVSMPAVAAPAPLGAAVTQNIQVQAGDMNPEYRGTPIEGSTGRVVVDAVARYRADRVTQPVQASSTSGVRSTQQNAPSSTGQATSQ
jgi:hypothetical protein